MTELYNRMTKQEALHFIGYLQDKEILIESHPFSYRTMFNHGITDIAEEAKALAELIRNARTPMEAYRAIARRKAHCNSNWRYVTGFGTVFQEDVAEYLLHTGAEHREEYAELVLRNEFRSLADAKELSQDFRMWAKTAVALDSRNLLRQYFPTEYMNYCAKYYEEGEDRFAVLSLPRVRNAVSPNAAENSPGQMPDPRRLCIRYDGEQLPGSTWQLITASKYLCDTLNLDRVILENVHAKEQIEIRRLTPEKN